MSSKTFSTKSNAHRAAVKAGLEPEQFETFQADDGRWGYRWSAAEYDKMEAAEAAEIVSDAELDAAAEEVGASVTWADDDLSEPEQADGDDEQSVEAIARRQAERMAATAPQEPTQAPELILRGQAPAEAEDAVTEPDEGRIDDPAQTVMAAAETPKAETAAPMAETTMVIGVPDWYSPGRRFILCIEGDDFPQSAPHAWAMEFAKRTQRTIVVRDATTFEALASYDKNAGRAAKAAAKAPSTPRGAARGISKEPADPTVKPIILSPTNQIVARLIDRIEAKRGDLEGLLAFRFKPSSTYYRKAWLYLQALIAEAESGTARAA